MKYLVFIFLLLLKFSIISGQINISGNTNFISKGKAILMLNGPIKFYEFLINNDTTDLIDNRFSFSLSSNYPLQFRLVVMNDSNRIISEPFFVEDGYQKIKFDSGTELHTKFDFGYGITVIGSKINNEYVDKYLPIYDSVNNRISQFYIDQEKCSDSLEPDIKSKCNQLLNLESKRIRNFKDSIFKSYVNKNPKASILPFIIYNLIRKSGYRDYYEAIINSSLKYTSQNIREELYSFIAEKKKIVVGTKFPLIHAIEKQTSNELISTKKYTLIDFWFSGCLPCIQQFKSLRALYQQFNKKDFEIIAVSVDIRSEIPKYRKILKLNNYPWKQVLDIGGKTFAPLNITKYPTNFLIDSEGKILFLDISPAGLENLLKSNL